MGTYDKIKKIAQKQGISIYRIEKDTGLSNGTIGKWNHQTPTSINLIKVAKYLGVEISDLLGDEEVKEKEKDKE